MLYCFAIYDFFFYLGTTGKRRNAEIKRLNELYVDILPDKKTIQKCLKYMCQTEPYKMLRDWSYEMIADPLTSDHGSNADFTEVCISCKI